MVPNPPLPVDNREPFRYDYPSLLNNPKGVISVLEHVPAELVALIGSELHRFEIVVHCSGHWFVGEDNEIFDVFFLCSVSFDLSNGGSKFPLPMWEFHGRNLSIASEVLGIDDVEKERLMREIDQPESEASKPAPA